MYIVGDLNVRLDRPEDINSRRLTELLAVYGLAVRRTEPTHVCGVLLDALLRAATIPRLL